MDMNKRFAKLAKIPWHGWVKSKGFAGECICGGVFNIHQSEFDNHVGHKNHDYATDPRLVLEAMMKRDDWDDFQASFCIGTRSGEKMFWGVHVDYILDKTGKLRDKAIEWITKTKGE